MDKLNVQAGGFKFGQDEINFWQDANKKAFEQLSSMAGDNVIINGVIVDGGDVSDGVIIYNKEVIPFVGGVKSDNVIIYEQTILVEYDEDIDNDGTKDMKSGLVKRFAKCGVGGVTNFPFTDLKRVRSLQNTRILGETMSWMGQLSKLPEGWLQAAGQTLNTVDYPDLFDVLGYTYGGASSTFKLPNLVNRVAVGSGGDYNLGSIGGAKTHQLTKDEMPVHSHRLKDGQGGTATNSITAGGGNLAGQDEPRTFILDTTIIENSGGNAYHNNMQPFIAINYIIYVGI